MDEVTRLALAAGQGDRVALYGFVRATQANVWRFCAHLTDRDNADDLTQETYLRALGALPRFRADASGTTWLLAIARRVVADHLRKRNVRSRYDQPAPRSTGGVDEHVAIQAAIADLGRERQTAFVLTQVLGLSYAEAAEICGCPVGTIRSRLARARADLIAAIGDDQAATQ
jgi:RNA polymerase sigma-70 factor (ECF subfamily)